MTSLQLKYLALVGLTAIALLYQNFTFSAGWEGPPTPKIQEKSRKAHAKELLGVAYKGSWAQQAESLSSLNLAIQAELESQLPAIYKSQSKKVAAAIISEASFYKMDPVFVLAMIKTESRFNPEVIGRHGEIGLMQIKPRTAAWIAKKTGIPWYGKQTLHNMVDNVRLGLAYMNYLRTSFTKRPSRYVNAYNMGSHNVRRLLASESTPRIYSDRILTNYIHIYSRLIRNQSNVLISMN